MLAGCGASTIWRWWLPQACAIIRAQSVGGTFWMLAGCGASTIWRWWLPQACAIIRAQSVGVSLNTSGENRDLFFSGTRLQAEGVPGTGPPRLDERPSDSGREPCGKRGKGGVDAVIQSLGEAVIMKTPWNQPLFLGWLYCGSRSGGRYGVFP
jgi:hypothetical protein